MPRLIALLLACVTLSPAIVQAQCSGAPITTYMEDAKLAELNARVDATLYGQGLYWSATKDGADITIMGTMHLPDPRHDALLARALPRLNAADLLLVEATLDDQSAMQTHMARNPELMVLPDGPTLPDLLDGPTWDAIVDAATARGIPGFMVAKMQPWFLNLTLAMPPCAMAAMMGGNVGLDAMLMNAAIAQSIPVEPLEPWQDMFALLSSGTFEEQMDALRMGLIAPALQDAMIVSLTDTYFEGNTAFSWHLARYTADFLPNIDQATFDAQMAQLEQLLLVDRNRDWIPVIESAAATHDRIFIGFGAAHLIGQDGVLNLLALNGWTITQL